MHEDEEVRKVHGVSILDVFSKFIEDIKQKLCDSINVLLGVTPMLIHIQVLHSSFLLWCCFWKEKRHVTDCFL